MRHMTMKLKKGKKHNNKGFTLIEVLVALAVSSVVITIVIAFISQGARFYKTQSNTINLQNELQETSNVITDTLQEATYLSITSNSKNLDVSLCVTLIYTSSITGCVITSLSATSVLHLSLIFTVISSILLEYL